MSGLAVAAPSEVAADAAEQVALAGGNAVDAALAAALVAMVNEVGIVSLSSGGFVTVQPAGQALAYTVDGWMDVPGRGRSDDERRAGRSWDVTTEYGGGVEVTIGPGSVATHGSVAAFGEAHARDGLLPWREVVAPAIAVARDGFRLGSATRFYLDYVRDDIFGWDDASRAALAGVDGELVTEPVVVAGLADSLEQIASDPRALHEGDLADAISRDVLERGGLLGPADLATYRPVVRPALRSRLGPWTLATTPPPSVGGVVVSAILRLLDGWSPGDSDAAARLVDAQRRVLGHRLDVLDHSTDLEADAATYLQVLESGSTAHVSAVDASGLACSVTVSSGYGSGMIARGTGIWLNNCLGEQELNPRGPHGAAPGTRLLSNMAPTVARHDDGSTLAIGSPGADRITTAITQVLARYAAGAGLQEAVHHPRVHVHRAGRPDEVVREETEPTMYFGGVGAALVGADGHLVAAADPRREGAVRLVGR
ncbi:gamma-glutamyltransferase [Nocardioides sp.]|uniref:gamma-glutamyltransferase n=1 Tax=Nocardioides sp. TaxID=35761 RepID=UPI002721E659|nr:gamma-glutamyltransferase [Nocardioides sp.]MDO9456591.1 gamma-glutamyltransferase [Nocardioides sp.]